jgi:DNA-binding transcriptional ArsR family regulator
MERFTAQVVRKNAERTNDNTLVRFLEFLGQRALPSNSSWRVTKTTMSTPERLPGFGWEFSGLIEFTKKSGRKTPELISKEKNVILARLKKAGNYARWGEGREWTVTEIPNLEEPALIADSEEEEVEDDVETIAVGPEGVLKLPTDFNEGKMVEVVVQEDGSILLRPIADREEQVDGENLLERESWHDTNFNSDTYELDRLRLASGPIRRKILNELRSGERNVSELCHNLGDVKQSAVSHHLTLLRATSLVERRRDGQRAYYSLTPRGRDLIENVAKAVS